MRQASLGPRLFAVAVILLIAAGAYYVAFAQSFATGSYIDPSCTAATTMYTSPEAAYLLFEAPGPNEGYGEVVTGTVTQTIPLTVSSTCTSYGLPATGTYTLYVVQTTGTATQTQGTATFTVIGQFIAAVYAASGCAATQENSFTQGQTAYVQFEMPGVSGNEAFFADILNSTHTQVVFAYTGLSSTSTCYAYLASNTGTYTAVISFTVATTPAVTGTSAFSVFSVGAALVPDLPYGIVPLFVVIALLTLMLNRRKAEADAESPPG